MTAIKEEIAKEIRSDEGIEQLTERCSVKTELPPLTQAPVLASGIHVTCNGTFVQKVTGREKGWGNTKPGNDNLTSERICHDQSTENKHDRTKKCTTTSHSNIAVYKQHMRTRYLVSREHTDTGYSSDSSDVHTE